MKRILFLMMLSLCFSCDQIIDNKLENQAIDNYISPFAGSYKGTYSGSGLNGKLTFKVSTSGDVEIIKSDSSTDDVFYSRLLETGAFNNAVSQQSGFQLFGNLQAQKGEWKMPNNLEGNWSVSKQ